MSSGAHKYHPSPRAGAVTSYIHADGRIGVLLEVSCESDVVAQTDEFHELIHDIAMHIAASNPKFIRKEDVTPEAYQREKDLWRSALAASPMLQPVAEKIVEGKMAEFCEKYCLLEQPFIKDQTISISRLIASKVGKLGENITVRRFARFKVGEGVATAADNRDNSPEGGDEAGVPVKKPQGPKSGSGFAAAKLGEESE